MKYPQEIAISNGESHN